MITRLCSAFYSLLMTPKYLWMCRQRTGSFKLHGCGWARYIACQDRDNYLLLFPDTVNTLLIIVSLSKGSFHDIHFSSAEFNCHRHLVPQSHCGLYSLKPDMFLEHAVRNTHSLSNNLLCSFSTFMLSLNKSSWSCLSTVFFYRWIHNSQNKTGKYSENIFWDDFFHVSFWI